MFRVETRIIKQELKNGANKYDIKTIKRSRSWLVGLLAGLSLSWIVSEK